MRAFFLSVILSICLVIVSCETETTTGTKPPQVKIETERLNSIDWENRRVDVSRLDSLGVGRTYLSVYSEIYNISQQQIRPLTATVSLRNPNETDTLFISKADYFDTSGDLIRSYVKEPIFVLPMETIEVVIAQVDRQGGTGGNFLFDWSVSTSATPPIFEGVMLSIVGTQAFSFVTRGWEVKR